MRITTKISTAGESGFIHTPALPHPADWYVIDETHFKPELRRELQNGGVTVSSDDTDMVLCVALELLDRMRISTERLMARDDSIRRKGDEEPTTRAERRMKHGKYLFVRVDIRDNVGGFRVAVGIGNPYDVVGRGEELARFYAQAYADNIVAIREDVKSDNKNAVFNLIEGEGCEGIFKRGEKHLREMLLLEKHKDCPYRHGGYCAPCQFNCELYKDSKCLYDTMM